MKRINDLLAPAMDALRGSGLIFKNKDKIDSILKEYDGYVASFAPSVITAGLKATLSFYTDRHKIKNVADYKPDFAKKVVEPRRTHVLNILHEIYQSKNTKLGGGDLLEIALTRDRTPAELRQMQHDLTDCAIALKLVMRNFKQEEKATNPEPTTT